MKITYGDIELTKYLRPTRGLDRKILPETEHQLERVGIADGVRHMRTIFGKRVISMPFAITNELIYNRRELARALSTREALPLIFDDEPDKVWYALPTGDISVDEIVILGHGTIDWIVPDGVAHAATPRIFTNVTIAKLDENQVLDPEYRYKDKYYKPWTVLLNEKYLESNILRGDFSDPFTIADKGETKIDGNYIFQNMKSTARSFPDMKPGDPFSFQAAIRIIKAKDGDTTGEVTVLAAIQELTHVGGKVLKNHAVRASELKLGTWQNLTLLNGKVTDERTKALNLVVAVAATACIDTARNQFNMAPTLAPFREPKTTLEPYIAVTNPGTYRAWPVIKANMNGENGLIAMINQNEGVLQFGNVEDIDIAVGKKSDKVIHDAFRKEPAAAWTYNTGSPFYPDYLSNPATPNLKHGSFNWTSDPEAVTPVYPSNTKQVWGGPTMYRPIPKNSSNVANGDFQTKSRFKFSSGVKNRGRFTITLQQDVSPRISFVCRDSSVSKDELVIEFYYSSAIKKTISLNKKKFSGQLFEIQITKRGDTLEFKFSKIDKLVGSSVKSTVSEIQKWNVPELSDVNITGVVGWFQRFANTAQARILWTDFFFTWINEKTVTNIPNLYNDNDMLVINTKERKVFLNGVENFEIHSIGNEWSKFAIEPGTTTILPVASEWANMAEIEIELRGAYM